MASLFRSLKYKGHQVIRIPELLHSLIAEPGERARARGTPIRGKDRFPYGEYYDRTAWVMHENFADCGGPRRQAGQVGDSSKITRALLTVRLNSAFTPATAASFISTKAFWLAGAWEGLNR